MHVQYVIDRNACVHFIRFLSELNSSVPFLWLSSDLCILHSGGICHNMTPVCLHADLIWGDHCGTFLGFLWHVHWAKWLNGKCNGNLEYSRVTPAGQFRSSPSWVHLTSLFLSLILIKFTSKAEGGIGGYFWCCWWHWTSLNCCQFLINFGLPMSSGQNSINSNACNQYSQRAKGFNKGSVLRIKKVKIYHYIMSCII